MNFFGKKISKVGIGLSQLNNSLYKYKKYSQKEILKFIEYAISKNIRYFDTANNYGDTEKIIGKLDNIKKDKIIISTKAGYVQNNKRNFNNNYLEKQIIKSLKRMKIERVDIFFLNKPTLFEIEKYDLLSFCDKMKKKGLIKYAGIIVGHSKLPNYIYKSSEVKCFSFLYNLVNVKFNLDLKKTKNYKKINFIRSPFNSGLLTEKFNLNLTYDKKDYRNKIFSGNNFYFKKKKIFEIKKKLNIDDKNLKNFSSRFVLSNKNIDICVFGASLNSHIDEIKKK